MHNESGGQPQEKRENWPFSLIFFIPPPKAVRLLFYLLNDQIKHDHLKDDIYIYLKKYEVSSKKARLYGEWNAKIAYMLNECLNCFLY